MSKIGRLVPEIWTKSGVNPLVCKLVVGSDCQLCLRGCSNSLSVIKFRAKIKNIDVNYSVLLIYLKNYESYRFLSLFFCVVLESSRQQVSKTSSTTFIGPMWLKLEFFLKKIIFLFCICFSIYQRVNVSPRF